MKSLFKNMFGLMIALGLGHSAFAQQYCPPPPPSGGSATSSISSTGTASFRTGASMNSFSNFMSQVSINQSYSAATTSLYANTDGSPYLFDEFQEGIVVKNNDMAFDGIQLNYDAYTGDVIAINQKGHKIALDERFYKKIVIKALQGDIVLVKANQKNNDRFVQVLYDDQGIVFYKDPRASIREGRNNGVSDSPDKFMLRNQYYVSKDGGQAVAVNLKKQDLFDHFPEIQMVAINEVIKKKKIKLRKESDYVALFAEF